MTDLIGAEAKLQTETSPKILVTPTHSTRRSRKFQSPMWPPTAETARSSFRKSTGSTRGGKWAGVPSASGCRSWSRPKTRGQPFRRHAAYSQLASQNVLLRTQVNLPLGTFQKTRAQFRA